MPEWKSLNEMPKMEEKLGKANKIDRIP